MGNNQPTNITYYTANEPIVVYSNGIIKFISNDKNAYKMYKKGITTLASVDNSLYRNVNSVLFQMCTFSVFKIEEKLLRNQL